MPVAQHDALERIAKKRGLKGKEKDRFVFGIMRKSGWKPKRELNALLDDLIEFKIQINPDNKGKFTATKKKSGKTTAELKNSKNPLTRKRATFAANAKKWAKNRKKQMSAETQPIEFDALPKLTKPKDIADRMRHILRRFNLKKKMPTSTNCLSAKLDEIILADPRPRNSLGEYTEQQEGVADPNSMAKTYAPIVQGAKKAGTTIAAGAGGAIGGLAVKEVYDKIKQIRARK